MKRVFAIVLSFVLLGSWFLTRPQLPAAQAAALPSKILTGYWHNFDNGSGSIRLRNVSANFDVINIAFAEPASSGNGSMAFAPFNATVQQFRDDVAYLQSQGKKVLISIGGANGTVELTDAAKKQQFVNSMIQIIETYGFDGMDIDLEGSSLSLNPGDSDFRNPTTPKIVNLIDGTRQIIQHFGQDFVLTMAPETAYVQGGMSAYGGPWGAYLPVIYALRDQLDVIHVQHYNSGPLTGLDGRNYAQGTADFHVAMAEMLLQGFPVAGSASNTFPALRPDQVAIGLPASPQAASGGYTAPAEVQKALDYLIKGQSFGGAYTLRKPSGYPALRGLMTWSINWDQYSGFQFSNSHRAYLNNLGGGGGNPDPGGDTTAPTAPTNLRVTGKTSTSVSLAWNASSDNVGVTGYIVKYGGSSVNVTGTTATVAGLAPGTSYTFTVQAKDAAGNISPASNAVTATTDAATGVQPWAPGVAYSVNDQVTYNGVVYRCIQAHTSLTGWEPPNVPALWQPV
ncbi:carbohydrate-binding protein [Cohnella laeviribosi]|uniref:carbohydrate-binding protein n=1 Tax=Cohnella laeviribosi TaxID=380174 RepID=UPI0003651685|nr:glycosyl hydrolase family 18 protein [Cohnella laeviribosi]